MYTQDQAKKLKKHTIGNFTNLHDSKDPELRIEGTRNSARMIPETFSLSDDGNSTTLATQPKQSMQPQLLKKAK